MRNLPKGHYVGYGKRFRTRRLTTIAVVPFGYHDGLEIFVSQPNGILDGVKYLVKQFLVKYGVVNATRKVKVNGVKCNILGKIGMQNCIIDVTDIKDNVLVGDVVEINTRRINLSHSILRVYRRANKIFYETETLFDKGKINFPPSTGQRREISIG